MKLTPARKQEIADFVTRKFEEHRSSSVYQNWKLLCENIRDAVDQRWRPGEQMTRTGLYIAALRAARDGFREGFVDTFGQAKPLYLYRPRRRVDPETSKSAQELMENTWDDVEGLTSWLINLDDAVDYSMGVTYTSWCRYGAEAEKPIVAANAWGDALEWSEEFDILLNQAHIQRIHPFNYRCDHRSMNPSWEGCEWEWNLPDLAGFLSDPKYDKAALGRVMERIQKGQIDGGSDTYYNQADAFGGDMPNERPVYAMEYWGSLRGITGMEGDTHEYCVTVVEGEIVRFNYNPVRGKKPWRPFTRTRLCPMPDLPIGQHILAPTLTYQRFKNLMLNLSADDVLIRQHLGLAVWPNQLKNPNDLLNPEGARGVLYMKDNASPNHVPRFFADARSGILQDAMALDDRLEQGSQMAGLPHSAMGMTGGGEQNQTATGQRLLASVSNRRSRAAILWAIETGLKPIGENVMLLTLRNRPPEDMKLTPQQHAEIWANNYWAAEDSVSWDQAEQAMALANWGQSALQQMATISPPDGSASHLVEYLKDLGRSMKLPMSRLDAYLPTGSKPQIGGPAPAGSQPPPAAAAEASPLASPMAAPAMTQEEIDAAMAA